MLSSLLQTTCLLLGLVSASPFATLRSRATNIDPVIDANFPDPSIFRDTDGTFYAFATNGAGVHVQVARAPSPAGPWEVLKQDLLPTVGAWSNGKDVWAPDVRKVGDNYVLYYSAVNPNNSKHCVAAATSKTVLGPYNASATALACASGQGGAIDISGFTDTDGTHFVVYKVDGNSIGHGGACGNTVAPLVPTPILLQRLESDGITPIGGAEEILDHIQGDGPYVEAPQIIQVGGVYFLFFSSNCYTTPQYDVKYATASAVRGPYARASGELLKTNMPFNLSTPGGAQLTDDGKNMVFHANCEKGRCMYERNVTISGKTVTLA